MGSGDDGGSEPPPDMEQEIVVEKETGDGGEEVVGLTVEEPPADCTNMRDCLARAQQEKRDAGGKIELAVVDENGDLVWDKSNEQPLWCLPENPNTSTLKKLHVELNFCVNREEAMIVNEDQIYFQHFSSPNEYTRIDVGDDDYLDWLNDGEYFALGVYGLYLAFYDFMADFVVEIFGQDSCPDPLPFWESANVGLNLQCGDMDLFDKVKINTNNSLLNTKQDLWVSPAVLPYDLNIDIDPNCTTSIRDFDVQYDKKLMVEVVQSANGGDHVDYAVTFYNSSEKNFTVRGVTLIFDYFYFALQQ